MRINSLLRLLLDLGKGPGFGPWPGPTSLNQVFKPGSEHMAWLGLKAFASYPINEVIIRLNLFNN